MFESLSKKLLSVIDSIKGKSVITETDVTDTLKQIKIALLEADVSLEVVKILLERIKEKALNQEVLKGVSAANQIIKIVNDELVIMLGSENSGLNITKTPFIILMAGLNGSGKTTTSAKLAKFIIDKYFKKVLMLSTDIYRPQAKEQLKLWGEKLNIDTLEIKDETPIETIKRALKLEKDYDVIIIDTAGRVHIDSSMMEEIKEINKLCEPSEVFLCADALLGQDSINIVTEFNKVIPLTGIIMTRMDGDARGGASLSMKATTNVPVKFIGVGEGADDLELFHPERIANRILGMGDIISLVEKAKDKIDENEAKKLAERMMSGKFTFDDMLSQFRQMKKLGSMSGIMKFIPMIGGIADKLNSIGMNDETIKHQEAIILSMTPKERKNPDILLMGRKKRIAKGAGVSLSDVEKLIKQYNKIKNTMEQMNKMGGLKGLMQMAKQMQESGDFAGMPDLNNFNF